MPDYKKAKIYKIIDLKENMVYIGSTTNALSVRMAQHRYVYKNKLKSISVHIIFDKHGLENCKIVLVENYPCINKEQLQQRESEYIKHNECVNKQL